MTRNGADKQLHAGAATVDITPNRPVFLTGHALREGKSTGVIDSLSARALFLQQANSQAVVIVCDLLGLDRDYVAGVRGKIQAETGIPAANVMLACTHTHSGPGTLFIWGCGGRDSKYLDWLAERLVQAARQAMLTPMPVAVRAGQTEVTGVSENRRAEGGPIDPALTVVSLETSAGQPLAMLLNYTCHPTCLQYPNMLVSGDYPGHVMRLVEQDSGAIALFFNGATGNIRPIRRHSVEALQSTAAPIAEAALAMMGGLAPVEDVQLRAASETLEAAYHGLPTEDSLANVNFRTDRPLFYLAERSALMDAKQVRIMDGWRGSMLERLRAGRLDASVPVEVQVIRMGPLALVGVGGELFVELGLALKQRAGLEHLMISCYTNDDVGYIPSRAAYVHGGYEVEEAYILHNHPSVLAPEVGEQVVEAALRLVQSTANESQERAA